MQDTQLHQPNENIGTRAWATAVKGVLSALILYFVAGKLADQGTTVRMVGTTLTTALSGPAFAGVLLLVALIPVNWALESFKWKLLAEKAIPLTFSEAFRSVLSGIATGFAVPTQAGEVLGRVAYFEHAKRFRTLGAAVVSSGMQFYVSVLAGSVGWYFAGHLLKLPPKVETAISVLLIGILSAGWILLPFRKYLSKWQPKRRWGIHLRRNLRVAGTYSPRELLAPFAVSLLRYLVFSVQFVIALWLLGAETNPAALFWGVSLVYLVKTLLPAIHMIADLGIRGYTALLVFSPLGLAPETVTAATLLVWSANLLIPMLAGVLVLWRTNYRLRYV